MVDKKKALETLRLKDESPSEESIIKAYNKLSRRYPSTEFPEKHASLLEAKEVLLRKDKWVFDYLFTQKMNLEWINQLVETSDKPEHEKLLLSLLRPVLRKNLVLSYWGRASEYVQGPDDDVYDPDDDEFLDVLKQMVKEGKLPEIPI